jgi:diphosphomevalonate decarboxylase
MNTKKDIVQKIISDRVHAPKPFGLGHAKANIALVKYWGKRDNELNLPETNSFSITLPLGTTTNITLANNEDIVVLNGTKIENQDQFYTRLVLFLNYFRPDASTHFKVETTNEIPTSAGLASSASGFAALTLALDSFFSMNLDQKMLSILSRLGSGSASRSIFTGFVEWQKGSNKDGSDSFAEKFSHFWPELRIGLSIISSAKKSIDSRKAMDITRKTSSLWKSWPDQVTHDITQIKKAIIEKDFELFGSTAEHNALAMHATMIAASPTILYWLPESIQMMHRIWDARKKGIPVYFTMDAGPNLKLLFLEKDKSIIEQEFPTIQTLVPPQ